MPAAMDKATTLDDAIGVRPLRSGGGVLGGVLAGVLMSDEADAGLPGAVVAGVLIGVLL